MDALFSNLQRRDAVSQHFNQHKGDILTDNCEYCKMVTEVFPYYFNHGIPQDIGFYG